MKFKLTLLALVILSIQAFSQSKNNISVVYGISNADVNIHGVLGDYGYKAKSGSLFGITYTHNLTKKIAIETGLLFGNDKVELNYIVGGQGEVHVSGEVKTISVPVKVKYSVLKWLYADAGFSADGQTNYNSNNPAVEKQSGLGFVAGLGGKYTVGPVTIFVNPYLHLYAITRSSNNLSEAGIKFGAGFNF